MFVFRTVCA